MMVLAQLLSLTIGMLVARASFAVMKTTDSAILGHVSTAALEASSVSDMYTGCTGVLAQGGVLGTFVSQAMGASNPKLAGAWLQVALVVTLSLSVPVAMLWTVTGPATRGLFGASNHIANMASYYAIVLATALPGRAAFTAVAQYFGAQRIVKPVSEAGIVGASLNLLVGLPVVLAPLHLGFAACPWVTSLVTYVQLAYLLYTAVHRQKLHAGDERRSCDGGDDKHARRFLWRRSRSRSRILRSRSVHLPNML
ncbi:protein detoxification [Pycnococcus provasolii]